MATNLATVEPINEESNVMSADELALLKSLMDKASRFKAEQKATNATEIFNVRYEAWKLDQQIKPLMKRRQELAKEHERLVVTGGSKIKISSDETAKFLRKFKSEQEAAKK